MRVAETSGKTVDEAVSRALGQLGLRRDQVDVDVIREGSKGFLGIGAEESIVRVTAKDSVLTTAAQPRRPQRPPRTGGGEGGDQGDAQPRRRGRRGGRGRRREDGPTESRGPSGRGGGRGGDRGPRPARFDAAPRQRGSSVPAGEEVTIPGAPDEPPSAPNPEPADQLDLAGSTLRDLLTLLGLSDTDISARDPETAGDGLGLIAQVFDIYGDDDEAADELGVLIGRRGETLGNLQYLLNTIVSRREKDGPVYGIDIEGYRRRREQQLVEMAKEVADEVRATGDVITLEPMPAAERRIIHITLAEEEGVRTESVGQGEQRQVEIMPA
jgi:spoIIIJ-associated protein